MTIHVNGDVLEIEAPLSVTALLDHLSLIPKKIAVELNLEIVSRSTFDTTMVNDGDRVEIVQFVGGG